MFAIRQISTGHWLPAFNGRAGGTYVEPSANAVPRLFRREQDAKASLLWWLRGHVVKSYDLETGEFLDFDQVPVKGREFNDMEVVPVSIVVERLL